MFKRIVIFCLAMAIFALMPLSVRAFESFFGSTVEEVQSGLDSYNHVPGFTGISPVVRRVDEGGMDVFVQTVFDEDEDQVDVTLVGNPTWVSLTKITAEQYEVRSDPGMDAAGVYNFIIRAMDALGGINDKNITVIVGDIAQGQILSYSPLAGTVTIAEGDSQVFFIEGYSPDGKPLTYTWYVSGVDQGINTPAFGLLTGYNDAGTHPVRGVVGDGTGTIEQQWLLVVTNTNRPPVWGATMPEQVEGIIGQEITLNLEATDPDGDPLTFSSDKGNISGSTWTMLLTDTGTFDVTFTVTDGDLSSDTIVTITVGDTTPPTVLDAYYIGVENNNGTTADVVVTVPVGTTFNPRVVGDLIGGGLWSYASGLAPNSVVGNQARFNNVHVTSLVDFGIYTSNGVVFPYSEVKVDWAVYLVSTDGHTYHLRLK